MSHYLRQLSIVNCHIFVNPQWVIIMPIPDLNKLLLFVVWCPVKFIKHSNHEIFRKYRSSRPKVFCKKGCLRNFAKFTRKHLCQSLFFNKVAGLMPATLLKKRVWHRYFLVNFVKFLRTPFSKQNTFGGCFLKYTDR